MIEVQEIYGVVMPTVVTIDRSKTFEQMLAAAERQSGFNSLFETLNPLVREKYDLHRRRTTETVNVYGFTNQRLMTTTTVVKELNALSYLPAAIIHWLAFGALCPDELPADSETMAMALGAGYTTPKIERCIAKKKISLSTLETPCLYYSSFRSSHRKQLSAHWVNDRTQWKPFKNIFLAIRKQGQG